MKKAFLILSVLLLFCIPQIASAGSATLQWQPNTEKDLAGYRAFVREKAQGYDYSKPAWEGTATTCKIDNLDGSKVYYFVVRAFDTEGYESGNSNEVSLAYGTVPDGIPPENPKSVTVTVTVAVPQ